LSSSDWPELPFKDWESTCDTLHMWTQIAGKTRMHLAPPLNQWWHSTFLVTPRGLATPSIPATHCTFDIEFDLVTHHARIRTSAGEGRAIPLYRRPVADFYAEFMACLHSLGIDVKFPLTPDEFDDPTPYDQDRHHASYDQNAVERFRRALVSVDRALQTYRARFQGKSSPVHFFWGSFDLNVTRFCGRRAPDRPGADRVTRLAYSHECISCGWWPGDRRYPKPAFYAYASPSPPGLEKEPHWNAQLGEFILDYDEVRSSASPHETALDFCQKVYESAAKLAGWDREALDYP
jgi:Family of unknown function (DUF5996)